MSNVSNDAELAIRATIPYVVMVTIKGVAPLLFHRWSCDDVESKSKAKKGSKEKKTDNVESYIYRNDQREICVPSEYLRMAIIKTAKFYQDPRSSRKQAEELFEAGIAGLTELCSLGKVEWDYLDRRRAGIGGRGITRTRPAFHTGWQVTIPIQCLLPEYISPEFLNEIVQAAGRFTGLGDFRPTYGRFQVVKFEVI